MVYKATTLNKSYQQRQNIQTWEGQTEEPSVGQGEEFNSKTMKLHTYIQRKSNDIPERYEKLLEE